jgi:hypothetical protein
MKYLKAYDLQRALSIGLAVVIAILVNTYLSYSKEYWIVLVAFLMGQTTRGTPLRQSLIFFLTILITLIIATLLMTIHQPTIIDSILGVIFIISSYMVYINWPLTNQTFFLIMLAAIILLLATLSPVKNEPVMQVRIIDAIIGAIIGILCAQFVFPINLRKEFSAGVVPTLKSLIEYSDVLTDNFIGQEHHLHQVAEMKSKVEMAFQTQSGIYPAWVYELGFNPGLRSGLRFFLINLERLGEILFSMNFLLTRTVDFPIHDLTLTIADSMHKNTELLRTLVEYFANNQLKHSEADFTGDIIELENALQKTVPGNLELLDLSPANITLTAFVRDVKDMRQILLQLVMALPATK